MAAGRVGDLIGRRGTLFLGALVFTIGGAIQTFTNGFDIMVVGRIISGFGVGLLSYVIWSFVMSMTYAERPGRTIVPIYQSEISPPDHVRISASHCAQDDVLTSLQRGALACMEFTGNVFGYAFSVVCIPQPTHVGINLIL